MENQSQGGDADWEDEWAIWCSGLGTIASKGTGTRHQTHPLEARLRCRVSETWACYSLHGGSVHDVNDHHRRFVRGDSCHDRAVRWAKSDERTAASFRKQTERARIPMFTSCDAPSRRRPVQRSGADTTRGW